ncbi:spermatogenesis-associated protein 17 [Kappamyces sp. JEL0680]|nr:spermatogenesis-associated protein 17 [Kappamyces sp. JEL0680]
MSQNAYSLFLKNLKSFANMAPPAPKKYNWETMVPSPFVKATLGELNRKLGAVARANRRYSQSYATEIEKAPFPKVIRRHLTVAQKPLIDDTALGRICGFRIEVKGRNGSRSSRKVVSYGSLSSGKIGSITGSMVDFGKSYFVHPKRGTEAEKNRGRERNAALNIQKMWRGKYIRKGVYSLDYTIKVIQRAVRKFIAYLRNMKLARELELRKRMDCYNGSATTIQRIWRGYWLRKYVLNMQQRRHYFEELRSKVSGLCTLTGQMSQVRIHVDQVQRQVVAERAIAAAVEEEHRLERFVRNKHHLVGTQSVPGVYSRPHSAASRLQAQISDDTICASPGFRNRIYDATAHSLKDPSPPLAHPQKIDRRPRSAALTRNFKPPSRPTTSAQRPKTALPR